MSEFTHFKISILESNAIPFSKGWFQINRFHNQLFMQRIIEALLDVRNFDLRLWTIISGANLYESDTSKFYYSYSIISNYSSFTLK